MVRDTEVPKNSKVQIISWVIVSAVEPVIAAFLLFMFIVGWIYVPGGYKWVFGIVSIIQAFGLIGKLKETVEHYELLRNSWNDLTRHMEDAGREEGDDRPYRGVHE